MTRTSGHEALVKHLTKNEALTVRSIIDRTRLSADGSLCLSGETAACIAGTVKDLSEMTTYDAYPWSLLFDTWTMEQYAAWQNSLATSLAATLIAHPFTATREGDGSKIRFHFHGPRSSVPQPQPSSPPPLTIRKEDIEALRQNVASLEACADSL